MEYWTSRWHDVVWNDALFEQEVINYDITLLPSCVVPCDRDEILIEYFTLFFRGNAAAAMTPHRTALRH